MPWCVEVFYPSCAWYNFLFANESFYPFIIIYTIVIFNVVECLSFVS